MTGKFIGYFRLVEACGLAGCPICRCVEEDSRRALDAILYEHVTDPEMRKGLRAAWGFCNWHAWALLDAETAATGAAILYEDLVRECRRVVERSVRRGTGTVRATFSRLRALVRRSGRSAVPRFVAQFRGRPRCPVCTRLARAEAAYVDAVVDFADDPQFAFAYQRSSGLCVPHLVFALERNPAQEGRATLVHMTLARWDDLRGRLERFVAKHEYRSTAPVTDGEADSYRLASELLAGRRQIFANDMQRSGAVDGRRR